MGEKYYLLFPFFTLMNNLSPLTYSFGKYAFPQRYRIFFPGKVCAHSLTRFQKNLYFFFPRAVFFFPARFLVDFAVFFFLPQKIVYTYSLTQIFGPGKKNTARKKKYAVFTHSLHFGRKCHECKLFRGKKNTIPLI